MREFTGQVVQIQGGVVDVVFPEGHLPDIYEAIELPRPEGAPLVLEVEKHMGDNWVRCVAMDSTDGLQRGALAKRTGNPIMVPVGEAALGRIFNVLGRPIDNMGPVDAKIYYPIHRLAP
ncbi:MAG: F0F1 ATP synthase subunit beta, partial [Anaerolineaceae bacterium]|nr:F0F1 ATP synthase subunit beta [Anaerolineaceae bacterium]